MTVAPVEVDGGFELKLSYGDGEFVSDFEDIYLRTDADGDLQYSTSPNSGFLDLERKDGTVLNVADGSVDSASIKVTYDTKSNDDLVQLYQSLFDTSLTTLHLQDRQHA